MSDSSSNSVGARYEEERTRANLQSQISNLQNQIDELRRLLRDQTQKYQLATEQQRKIEHRNHEVENQLARQNTELQQTLEGFRRDMSTLRKEYASTLIKVEESIQPIRDMQSQIQELANARKDDRVAVAGWINRLGETEQKIGALLALVKESDERHRTLIARLDTFQSAEDTRRAELRKILEEVQIEKQQLRRQAVENQQLVADSKFILSEQQSRLLRFDDFRKQMDNVVNEIPEQLVVLSNRIAELMQENKQLERVTTERFLANQQRIEEIRLQQDDKISGIQDIEDRHIRQITTWIERIDTYVRELEQRITRTHNRVETMQHDHVTQLGDINTRDAELLALIVKTLQGSLDRIKPTISDGKSS